MNKLDYLYLALITCLLLLDYFALWPAFLRRARSDPGKARIWLWSLTMIASWTVAGLGIALWGFEARAWESLRFVVPQGWRLWGSAGVLLVVAFPFARTILRIATSKRPLRVKMGNPQVEKYSPHTRAELTCFVAVSLTAGFCEEFIFRGYLIWAFQPLLGLWGAAAFSVVLFGFGHAYQGTKGIVATGAVGAVLTLVVLISGSLWPAIALHALVDIGQGVIAWLALRDGRGEFNAATPSTKLT